LPFQFVGVGGQALIEKGLARSLPGFDNSVLSGAMLEAQALDRTISKHAGPKTTACSCVARARPGTGLTRGTNEELTSCWLNQRVVHDIIDIACDCIGINLQYACLGLSVE